MLPLNYLLIGLLKILESSYKMFASNGILFNHESQEEERLLSQEK